MGGRTLFRVLMGILLCGLALLALRMFSPATVRDDRALDTAPSNEYGTGRRIPENVLAAPEIPGFDGALGDIGTAHWYMPYAVINEGQGIAMVEAITATLLRGDPLPEKLVVPGGRGAGGGDLLHPIRPGVARMFYGDGSDAPGENVSDAHIPLVISQPEPGHASADVLFADGHLQSVPLGQFPLSHGFIEALEELDPPEHEH